MDEAKPPEVKTVRDIEFAKQLIDYVKHLTTLSTGSILLLATFLQKVFEQQHWKLLAIISFTGFIFAVACAVYAHGWVLDLFSLETENYDQSKDMSVRLILLIWLGFLIGLVSLSIFTIRNIL